MGASILIIDDDKQISQMMRKGLIFEGYDVNTAPSGREGLRAIMEREPDLVILDWMMPDLSGIEVCRRLRKESRVPILMVTAKDAVNDRVDGLEAGADDYVIKPFAFEELAARVKALLRRVESSESNERLSFQDVTLDLRTRLAVRGDREIALSTTEFRLLSFFISHPHQVLTREILMDRVWGYDFQGESNVLEVYVGYLRQKLEEQGEPRIIHTVRGAGYVLKP